MMLGYFILASAVGAVLRYLADFYLPAWGILLANVVGSGIGGFVFGLAWKGLVDPVLVLILLSGFAGSLTTYSTVALTTARQWTDSTRAVARTWLQHTSWSIVACMLGLFITIGL